MQRLLTASYIYYTLDNLNSIRKLTGSPWFAERRGISPDTDLRYYYYIHGNGSFTTKKFYYTYSPFMYVKKPSDNSPETYVFIPRWWLYTTQLVVAKDKTPTAKNVTLLGDLTQSKGCSQKVNSTHESDPVNIIMSNPGVLALINRYDKRGNTIYGDTIIVNGLIVLTAPRLIKTANIKTIYAVSALSFAWHLFTKHADYFGKKEFGAVTFSDSLRAYKSIFTQFYLPCITNNPYSTSNKKHE